MKPPISILFLGVSDTIILPVVLTIMGLNLTLQSAKLSEIKVILELSELLDISCPIIIKNASVVIVGYGLVTLLTVIKIYAIDELLRIAFDIVKFVEKMLYMNDVTDTESMISDVTLGVVTERSYCCGNLMMMLEPAGTGCVLYGVGF